ncbi:hypothetical protein [Bacillus sp. Marseille-Q1617]|jgi:hypothetical protein|uniref:hypothetical protein n=1 Tax=Bacillus sp. Marseille-Q1617 TaxID=2736887 RepID=UPI00158E4BDB|nr:hypothetical protein [Bacillus sp. Marseille-Q1617]
MKFKGQLGILVLGCVVAGAALLGFSQKEPYSTGNVMDSLWDEYSVQSTMIGDTDPVLDVSVYDEEDINDVEDYLESNLSEEDLKHYKLNVYEWSSDVSKLKENAQENLGSDNLNSDND